MTRRQMAGVAAALLGIAAALAAVGGPAAVASYHHAYSVFVTYGEAESRAAWLPLTTDGMLAAALVVMYSRRWSKQRVGGIPWLAFAVGFSGTIAANLASANAFGAPTVGEAVGRLAAAVWSPICFAVTLELVAVMLGKVRDYVARVRVAAVDTWPVTWLVGIPDYPYSPPPVERAAARPEPAYPELVALDDVEQWHRNRTSAPRTRKPRASAPAPAVPAAPGTPAPGTNGKAVRWTDADEVIRMELQGEIDEAEPGAPLPSVRSLKTRYGMSQDRASKIRARLAPRTPRTAPDAEAVS